MEKIFAIVTIFTLLFALTTARITFDHPSSNNLPVLHNSNFVKSESKAVTEDSNNIVLPSENEATKSKPNANNIVTETEKSQQFRVPRSDFARFHAINRHFFDEPRTLSRSRSVHRRPYRHFSNPFVIPRSEFSHGNDVVFPGDNLNVDRRPAKRMKYKHDNGHRHRRHRYHHHIHHGNDNNNNEVSVMKHKFDLEKVKSSVHQHEQNKRERDVGFMKSIRKFLKHTFE